MTELVDKEGSRIAVPTIIPSETAFPYPLKRHATDDPSTASLTQPNGVPRNNNTSDEEFPPLAAPRQRAETEPSKRASPFHKQNDRESLANTRTRASNEKSIEEFFTGGRPTQLNRAVTEALQNDSSDSSSSSSSSSEDEDEKAKHKHKHKHNKHGKGANRPHVLAGLQRMRSPHEKKDHDSAPYNKFSVGNDHYKTRGRVSKKDGRLRISVNETANSGYLAKALGMGIRNHFMPGRRDHDDEEQLVSPISEEGQDLDKVPSQYSTTEESLSQPKLNIVVIVIGSRGDIQPFIKIARILQNEHGHRVRIATHPAFKKFVQEESGLEFFSVGGDPSELMAFMVKNPGLIPSLETVKAGEIGKRRASMFEMFQGMWRACINATDDETDKENMKMMAKKNPFVADAIIANPPSFAHVHIAERLGIPLHMMFTFPYTPTTQFSHPLANIKASNVDYNYTNFMSYPLVELMTWQGLGDLINRFRVRTLGLEPVSTLWAPGQLYRLKVPHTYLWSPGLVPKPPDWGPEIDIAGFVFLDLASSFKPPDDLVKFLEDGEQPVYIGFGSIVVDDPDKFTEMIFKAVEMAGVRALVSKGWGGLGGENTPENIFMLENTPHDWLFPRVSAVVHHGGAGTTAIGLKCGKPTMIVPFFGDQPFWGAMVAARRAGAFECIPYKKLNAEKLAKGIKECLSDEAKKNAAKIAESIAKEGDGAQNAVQSFHRSLPLRGEHSMRCCIFEDRVAVWQLKNTPLRLSALAAELLVEKEKIKRNDLRLIRHYEWNDFDGPGEPVTGGGAAVIGTVTGAAKGVGLIPVRAVQSIKKREHHNKKKRKIQQGKAEQNGEPKGPAKSNHQRMNAAEPNGRPLGPKRGETKMSALSADPEEGLAEELTHEAGRGFEEAGAALVKAPMDLSLAVAQGFHNAPRLYGDETVRRPPRISGFHSGLRAARNEFVYGIHDGVTGLVTQPLHGLRTEGPLGLVKGLGMGIGGFVLKDIAAVLGPFGYTLKGIHKEIQKKHLPTAFIRRARIVQGQKDVQLLREGRATGGKAGVDNSNEDGDGYGESGGGGRGGGKGEGQGNGEARDGDPEKSPTASHAAQPPERPTLSLADASARVDAAWPVIQELLTRERKRRADGPLGKLVAKRERARLQEFGALESVGAARRALEAKKKGERIEEVFARQRGEIRAAEMPRRPAMEGQGGEGEGEGDEGGKGGGGRGRGAQLENGRRVGSWGGADGAADGRGERGKGGGNGNGNGIGREGSEDETLRGSMEEVQRTGTRTQDFAARR